jgi:hypothetical protein
LSNFLRLLFTVPINLDHISDFELAEISYKAIDSNIRETGSDLPRALLAYYFAFIHTMKKFSTSAFCPIVIDTPVQQDQDEANAARMISFCLSQAPQGSQLILGTVGLHGVEYDGHVIKTDTKNRLLKTERFEEVSGILKPFYANSCNDPVSLAHSGHSNRALTPSATRFTHLLILV